MATEADESDADGEILHFEVQDQLVAAEVAAANDDGERMAEACVEAVMAVCDAAESSDLAFDTASELKSRGLRRQEET